MDEIKIKLDDKYTLHKDRYCTWLTKMVTAKNGRVREENTGGYFNSLEDLLTWYFERVPVENEAKSLAQMTKAYKDGLKQIKEWVKNVGR